MAEQPPDPRRDPHTPPDPGQEAAPDAGRLSFARRLFARTIETPGVSGISKRMWTSARGLPFSSTMRATAEPRRLLPGPPIRPRYCSARRKHFPSVISRRWPGFRCASARRFVGTWAGSFSTITKIFSFFPCHRIITLILDTRVCSGRFKRALRHLFRFHSADHDWLDDMGDAHALRQQARYILAVAVLPGPGTIRPRERG